MASTRSGAHGREREEEDGGGACDQERYRYALHTTYNDYHAAMAGLACRNNEELMLWQGVFPVMPRAFAHGVLAAGVCGWSFFFFSTAFSAVYKRRRYDNTTASARTSRLIHVHPWRSIIRCAVAAGDDHMI